MVRNRRNEVYKQRALKRKGRTNRRETAYRKRAEKRLGRRPSIAELARKEKVIAPIKPPTIKGKQEVLKGALKALPGKKIIRGGVRAATPLEFDIVSTQITSMRGRIHPMAQQPFDQPQTPQTEFVDSTAIASYKYSTSRKILEIVFLVSGKTYRYFGVPLDVVRGFGVAESKGRYFNRMIRNKYSYLKV